MLDRIEALQALADEGTMPRAAARLRLTTSAVSKRIAALEESVGRPVLERAGRRVRLTDEGRRLVEATGPLVARIRDALREERRWAGGEVAVGVAESILASWGPGVLTRAVARVAGLRLEVHAHRGPVVQERVVAGAYAIGLVAGRSRAAAELSVERVAEEPMGIVPRGLEIGTVPRRGVLPVIGPEPTSGTARALELPLARLRRRSLLDVRIVRPLESAAAIVQCAREGLGHGLAPLGIIRAMGIPEESVVRFEDPPLLRPITLLTRSGATRTSWMAALREALKSEIAASSGTYLSS